MPLLMVNRRPVSGQISAHSSTSTWGNEGAERSVAARRHGRPSPRGGRAERMGFYLEKDVVKGSEKALVRL